MNDQTHFIVVSKAARMPSSCRGTYRRVAVLEVNKGQRSASMISERAYGVRRIVETWEKLNVGSTDRCAYGRAMKAAQELATRLNDEKQSSSPSMYPEGE